MRFLLARTFASLGNAHFRYLWLSIGANGYSNTVSMVALGWMALEFTGSPIGVGLVIASRTIPKLVFSLPLGILSDRMSRRILLQVTNYTGVIVSLAAVALSVAGGVNIYVVLALAMLVGALDAAQTTFCKAYVIDVIGIEDAVNGMTMEAFANRAFGVIGGFTSGWLLYSFGGTATFVAMAGSYFLSGALLHGIPQQYMAPDVRSEIDGKTSLPYIKTLIALMRNPMILIFATIALTAEVFGYSSEVLLPSFARDVHQVGERGLGILIGLANAGGVIALLVMAGFARRVVADRMLLICAAMFGINLVLFAYAPTFVLAASLMIFVGMTWSLVDVLLPTAFQMGVHHADRGSAMGIWNLSRGFGPLGQLEIGLLASTLGIVLTQALNGMILLSTTLAVGLYYVRVRRATRIIPIADSAPGST